MRARHGFTLIETVIAIALVLALAGSISAFAWNLAIRRTALLEAATELDNGARVFDAVERAVSTSIASAGGETGIRGTSDSLTVRYRGSALSASGDSSVWDNLRLQLTHRAARAELTLALGSGSSRDTVTLDRVSRVRLRYRDAQGWSSSFDSAQGGLPQAIEMAIWFGEPDLEESAFDLEADGDQGSGFDDALGAGRMADAPFDDIGFSLSVREPDRVRVIVIPDGASAGGGVSDLQGGAP